MDKTYVRYFNILTGILQRGQERGVNYKIATRASNVSMVDRQSHILTARSITIEAPMTINLTQESDQIGCEQVYYLEAPFKIIEIIPILKDFDKLEIYDSMGFFVLNPSPLTFTILNGQSCSIVVAHTECLIFGSRVKHKDIDPRKLLLSTLRIIQGNAVKDGQNFRAVANILAK